MQVTKCLPAISLVFLIGQGQSESLIKTTGCTIPEHPYHTKFVPQKLKAEKNKTKSEGPCPQRFVSLRRLNDKQVEFSITKGYDSCCYSFVYLQFTGPSEKLMVTECVPMTSNATWLNITSEFINVKCYYGKQLAYEDYFTVALPIYGFLQSPDRHSKTVVHNHWARSPFEGTYGDTRYESKKNFPNHHRKNPKKPPPPESNRPYSVIMIGIEAVSRARAQITLHKTHKFMSKGNWFDFKGFQKVSINPIENVMATLTGSRRSIIGNETCIGNLSECSEQFIWTEFRNRGYATAYGEDTTFREGMFHRYTAGFMKRPTNHYMRPLFLASENKTSICSKRMTSAEQMLHYIIQLDRIYKHAAIFGFFWIGALHHFGESPKLLDEHLLHFFKQFQKSGGLNNTFVILFSDTGMGDGAIGIDGYYRKKIRSYFEDRLPMLYIHVPDDLKMRHHDIFSNIEDNAHGVVSHMDLYLTLWDILKLSTHERIHPKAKDCLRCASVLKYVPHDRTCADAEISEHLCACRDLETADLLDYGTMYGAVKSLTYLKKMAVDVLKKSGTVCQEPILKRVLSSHNFSQGEKLMTYVYVMVMSNDMIYETTVNKYLEGREYKYEVVEAQLITPQFRNTTWCVLDRANERFCLCEYYSLKPVVRHE